MIHAAITSLNSSEKGHKIPMDSETGIIIEVKYAHDGNLESACQEAIAQIRNTRYDDELKENGTRKILRYGIVCYLKRCKVGME